jgi:diacylglycerol kinase (ATP)
MEKKSILFVVNQLSGTVSSYNIPKCIEMFLDHSQFVYKTHFIEHGMEQTKYEDLLSQAWDIIVSVGGDGTLLDIGQKILHSKSILGIIPIGSGNGLASHMGYIPRDIEAAFVAINNLKTDRIDVASINDSYFFSNFGYGLDAVVAKDFKIKKKRSLFVYAFLTLKRIIGMKAQKVVYKTATSENAVETYLFNVFNSNLFGYNVGMLPWASARDGKLDVVYLKKTNLLFLAWAGICILCKRPNWSKQICFFETEDITILNNEKLEYQIDGDPKLSRGDIQINVLPQKLEMIIP